MKILKDRNGEWQKCRIFMTGMEVWMRRSDRELKDMADIVAIAKRETVCTVAFHDESCPYLIPLNYGAEVEEGKLVLYFHGAKEGTKIDKIRENPQVSYCIYGKNSLKINYDAACKSTTSFESICGSVFIYGYQFLVFVVQIEAQMS